MAERKKKRPSQQPLTLEDMNAIFTAAMAVAQDKEASCDYNAGKLRYRSYYEWLECLKESTQYLMKIVDKNSEP